MTYARAAVERAMKVQEVILRALSGRQSWLQVADVLGVSARTVRRLRLRYQKLGYSGLFDRRRRRCPRAVPLDEVLTTYGLPAALYTDRAHWAVHTPTSGTAPDRTKLTQVGRALARLGIEHILGYSPQARGRSERANGTLQGRLVSELRVAGITTVAAANRYVREHFISDYNARFARRPADPASAFVPVGR